MPSLGSTPVVKMVGANGQIYLGKQWAGRQVLIEEQEPGVWLVRMATVIPDNERGLHAEPAASKVLEALDWAQSHPASDTQTDAVLKRLRNRRA